MTILHGHCHAMLFVNIVSPEMDDQTGQLKEFFLPTHETIPQRVIYFSSSAWQVCSSEYGYIWLQNMAGAWVHW